MMIVSLLIEGRRSCTITPLANPLNAVKPWNSEGVASISISSLTNSFRYSSDCVGPVKFYIRTDKDCKYYNLDHAWFDAFLESSDSSNSDVTDYEFKFKTSYTYYLGVLDDNDKGYVCVPLKLTGRWYWPTYTIDQEHVIFNKPKGFGTQSVNLNSLFTSELESQARTYYLRKSTNFDQSDDFNDVQMHVDE